MTLCFSPALAYTVVVVGHTHCGGVAGAFSAACAAQEHDAEPAAPSADAESTPLQRWLAPLIALAKSLRLSTAPAAQALPVLVEENVKRQVENVCKSPVLARAWARGAAQPVAVHGWVYALESGTLRDLGVSRTSA